MPKAWVKSGDGELVEEVDLRVPVARAPALQDVAVGRTKEHEVGQGALDAAWGAGGQACGQVFRSWRRLLILCKRIEQELKMGVSRGNLVKSPLGVCLVLTSTQHGESRKGEGHGGLLLQEKGRRSTLWGDSFDRDDIRHVTFSARPQGR